MITQLPFKKLNDKAVLPTRESEFAAALDLSSIEEINIPTGGTALVHTGLAVEIPAGYYGRVAPRSGLAAKHGIDTLAGVIDSDYRGELVCVLANFGKQDFLVKPGDRIAQFIIEAIITPEPVFVDNLSDTVRAEGGFGSTSV